MKKRLEPVSKTSVTPESICRGSRKRRLDSRLGRAGMTLLAEGTFLRWLVLSLSLIVLLPLVLSAQGFTKAGTSAAQFLKIPVGAKAASMGNAYSSIGSDATALYWNPACVAGLKRLQGTVAHSSWIAGLMHNFAGVVVPMGDRSAIGISGIALQSEKIEQTTIENPRGTGVFYDALDLALGITYSRSMTEFVDIGVTGKYISQRIWSESGQTFALDFGAVLKTGFKDLKLGVSFQNFGPGLTMGGRELIRQLDQDPASTANPYIETTVQTQQWDLPTSYRVTTSMSLVGTDGLVTMSGSRFLIALDAIHLNDNPEHYSIGGEYEFQGILAIRGGYVFKTDEEGLTLGLGVNIPAGGSVFTLDYAYAAFGLLGSVSYFSVSAAF